MLLFLPFLSFCAWFRALRFTIPEARERLLIAATWWVLCLIAITELLSAFQTIFRQSLAIAWAILAALTFIVDTWRHRGKETHGPAVFNREALGGKDWVLLGLSVAILALTAITALIAPPNGWDVTLQHMPRVMEWIAQGSVGLFPTNYYVQDFAPPLAEWTMLHLTLLNGSDRFVNFVQWLGFAGSALGVGLIAKEFGCAIRGQLFAMFLCLTLPQGILSASGAKNDWTVALWLTVAVFLILRWQRDRRWFYVVTLGVALGALILSKGTAYAFGPPIAVALLFVTPRHAWRKLPAACLVAAAIMLLMNAHHWAQNDRLGHSVLGLPTPDIEGHLKYTADRITPATVAANLLRESSIHFGTPFSSINRRSTSAVRKMMHAMKVNPDDPGLIRPGPRFAIPAYSLDEYFAGNPFHLLLIVFTFIIVLLTMRTYPREAALAIGILAAFVFYCAVFKWELWAARLHLALFVLACPIVAAVFYRRYPRTISILTLVLLVLAIPPLLFNAIRPLMSSNPIRVLLHRPADPQASSIFFRSRDEMYFAESVDLEPTYLPAAEAARAIPCAHIGLDTSDHPIAYGYILMGIIDHGGPLRKFRYVGVDDLSSRFTSKIDAQPPCMVLCIRCLRDAAKMAKYSARLPEMQSFGTLVLFHEPTQ